MGVKEDIRWLKESEDRVDLFAVIAKQGPLKVREIREFLGFDDWWPMKFHVKDLVDRGVIEEVENGYRVTESGSKVFESLSTVYDIESV